MTDELTLDRDCPVCSHTIPFPAFHCECDEPCECGPLVWEGDQQTCPKCGALVEILCDGEYAEATVEEDDPAWEREKQP